MNKKEILPIIIASIIALVVTIIVKFFISNTVSFTQQQGKKEIIIPNIPLIAKKNIQQNESNLVLFVAKNFKKDEKIILNKLHWKKWPADAMQSYFIAKSYSNIPLNNKTDYSNALKMWANTDIPSGTPLSMSMLTNENPQEKRKKKNEVENKKLEQKKEEAFITKGMRAVTFPIDHKSAVSITMLKPGDLVDVLIMNQNRDKQETHKYKALKILAIDGVTMFDADKDKDNGKKKKSTWNNDNNRAVNEFTTPKNITLEVEEKLVETMLQQVGPNGIILSIRNQFEKDNKKDSKSEQNSDSKFDPILHDIISMNDAQPGNVQNSELFKKQKKTDAKNTSPELDPLLRSVISMNDAQPGNVQNSELFKNQKKTVAKNTSPELDPLLRSVISMNDAQPGNVQNSELFKNQKKTVAKNTSPELDPLLRNVISMNDAQPGNAKNSKLFKNQKKTVAKNTSPELDPLLRSVISMNDAQPGNVQNSELFKKQKKTDAKNASPELDPLLRNVISMNDAQPGNAQNSELCKKQKKTVAKNTSPELDPLLRSVISMNDAQPGNVQNSEQRKQLPENSMKALMDNILSINSNIIPPAEMKKTSKSSEIDNEKTAKAKYLKANPKFATIYRKLIASKVNFDEKGRIVTNGNRDDSDNKLSSLEQ